MYVKVLFILVCVLTSLSVYSAQVCEDYIDNAWFDSRYLVENISDDFIVTDLKNGLMWKQCGEGLNGANCSTGLATQHNWQDALTIPETLNSSTGYAGFNDWRLPNVQELRSLIAYNCYDPAINETIFPETRKSWYISSTPIIDFPDRSWIVFFSDGNAFLGPRNLPFYVRLVR